MNLTLLPDTSTKAVSEVFSPTASETHSPAEAVVKVYMSQSSGHTWWAAAYQIGGDLPQVTTIGYALAVASDLNQWYPPPEPEALDFVALQRAAESQDPRTFTQLARAMKWRNRGPNDLTRTIDLALTMDMVPLARQLAEHGRKLFPNDERLRQLSAVLAPPVVLETRPSQPKDFEASQQWLREHASQFQGQWVAVRGGTLLGCAPTLKELYEQIGPEGKSRNTVIVKVLHNASV